MPIQLIEPDEKDSIDCHLQRIGIDGLTYRAAQYTGQKNTTNIEAGRRACSLSCFVLR